MWRVLMEHLFIRKKLRLSAGSDPRILIVCLAIFCGAGLFALIRDEAVGYIVPLVAALGVEPVFLPAILCLLILTALHLGILSAAAFAVVPCICAASGFSAAAASYTYSGASFPAKEFLLFSLLVFAYVFSVLAASTGTLKLSKSIQNCIRVNKALKTELFRYQFIFILIVLLLMVIGYFALK